MTVKLVPMTAGGETYGPWEVDSFQYTGHVFTGYRAVNGNVVWWSARVNDTYVLFCSPSEPAKA